MGVFRSDQAQVTFAAEPAQGADIERYTSATVSNASTLDGAVTSGALSITLTSGSSYVVGDFIRIGEIQTALQNVEVRRVEYKDGNVVYLDRPVAFYHADDEAVKRLTGNYNTITATARFGTSGRKYITFVPGVYETVDVPDPEMAIEPRYFLGTTAKRNYFQAYKGQQAYSGGISDMILLNGWPLRFPIGKIITVASSTTTSGLTIDAASKRGDVFINPAGDYTSNFAVGADIIVEYEAAPTTASKMEIRTVVGRTSAYIELDYPLHYDHASGVSIKGVSTSAYYTHHIIESTDLDTISMHVYMRSSNELDSHDFSRRYLGGMVGSMTISAEEGGLLTCGWDTIPFMNMIHNQKGHDGFSGEYGSGSLADSVQTDIPGFALMHDIVASDVNQLPGDGSTTALDAIANSHNASSTTEPYYFSRGSLKFNGNEFARVRNFSLSITNNEEPRYYISKRFGRNRGPSELREQQREYTLTVDVAVPDTATHGASSTINTATGLFRELLLEGDYGTDANPNMKGITARLEFLRGTNDRIVIDMPGIDEGTTLANGGVGAGTAGTSSAEGGNNQGLFIRTAPHSITGDNPMQVSLDMLVRNLKITIEATIPVYP